MTQQEKDPHYGEPSGQDPDMGEGGSKPDTADPEGRVEEGKQHAAESGGEAEQKQGEGGSSQGMASAN